MGNTWIRSTFFTKNPRGLGDCDAFISHSWSDDPDAKWRALTSFRKKFVARNSVKEICGRRPWDPEK